ncbi:hypothetical protein TKK_0009462 [Trichogramma kaykai]
MTRKVGSLSASSSSGVPGVTPLRASSATERDSVLTVKRALALSARHTSVRAPASSGTRALRAQQARGLHEIRRTKQLAW